MKLLKIGAGKRASFFPSPMPTGSQHFFWQTLMTVPITSASKESRLFIFEATELAGMAGIRGELCASTPKRAVGQACWTIGESPVSG